MRNVTQLAASSAARFRAWSRLSGSFPAACENVGRLLTRSTAPESGSSTTVVTWSPTPRQEPVAAAPASFTGEYLRPVLELTTLAAD
jgi:hypothetical protein